MTQYRVRISFDEETIVEADNEDQIDNIVGDMHLNDFWFNTEIETVDSRIFRENNYTLEDYEKCEFNGLMLRREVFIGKENPFNGFNPFIFLLQDLKDWSESTDNLGEVIINYQIYSNDFIKEVIWWLEGLNGDEELIFALSDSYKDKNNQLKKERSLIIKIIHPSKWELDPDIDYIVIAPRTSDD